MKHTYVPRHVREGIGYKKCHCPEEVVIFGGDTETANGEIEMIQICDGRSVELLQARPHNALHVLSKYLDRVCHRGVTNVAYFHNLTFDMEVLLMPYIDMYRNQRSFKLETNEAEFEFNMGKICFVDVTFSKNRTLFIRDSAKVVAGSLESVANKLRLIHRKTKRPEGIGVRSPWDPDIREYAINDGWVTWEMGKWIVDNLNRRYDVPIVVSYSQFSQKLYQSQFLTNEDHIPFPPDGACHFGERSYHGGKNGLYIPAPVVIEKCYDLDIVSAYADALQTMPRAFHGKYAYVDKYEPGTHGVYCIDGCIKPTKFPILFQEDSFRPAIGDVKGLHVVSYELDKAMSLGLVSLTRARGWLLRQSAYPKHAFKPYVEFWWNRKKQSEEGTMEYRHSKLGPNAIYGKLIGRVELDGFNYVEKDGQVRSADATHRACSFYNPLLATLVTAKTRLKLLELETRYDALHSATDAVKCLQRPKENPGVLGGCEIEIFGRCIILRNKLYLHFNEKDELEKCALHGFWGSPDQLLGMIEKGMTKYECNHMPKLRETLRQVHKKLTPFMMHKVERELKINFNDWHYVKADRVSDVNPETVQGLEGLEPTL